MSRLSDFASKLMAIALTKPAQANEVVDKLNEHDSLWSNSSHSIAAAIVATATSTTTDFAALKVGDQLIHIAAAAGNANFETVATAGTKPSAAVIGDLYIALRAKAAPAASNIIL